VKSNRNIFDFKEGFAKALWNDPEIVAASKQ